ncbi:MAG: family N-acetyltransferase [Anaerocolumna sp.]|jgi:RimJ/RimL family protein N-acetyltransferase|nr:family N-acetyltransferase [Anaerocolumna sp.]
MLRLRPYKVSDIKFLVEWTKDERLFSMWCANKFTYPLTESQLIQYKNMYDDDEFGWSFTALDEEGTPVGHILMRMADYKNASIHFGFVLIDPTKHGNGYGKEMIKLAITYATEICKVKKVTLGVFSNNHIAHNCYKSIGFVDQKYHEDIFSYKDEKWGLYDMLFDLNT